MIERSTHGHLVEELEGIVGEPVIVVAANWRGEYAVDLDEVALRIFFEVLDSVRARAQGHLTLVLAMRGGLPSFADGVLRVLQGLGVEYRVLLPCLVDGAGGILCLGAREI